jgi:ABC-type transport system involved in multi-copper enzyme maturation permease subunit
MILRHLKAMSSASSIFVIAHNTFREAIRAQVLAIILFAALLLISTVLLFGMVTIGDHTRVVMDFGFFTMSVSCVGYAAISGAHLLEKELKRRTVYNVLSKPINRWCFVLGKFVGLLGTSLLLLTLIWALVLALVFFLSGRIEMTLFTGLLYQTLEVVFVCSCVIFFSSLVVTPVFVGLFTAAVYLAGRSSEYFLYFVTVEGTPAPSKWVLYTLYYCVPNFAQVNVANQITFGDQIPLLHTVHSIVYVFGYSAALLILSSMLFERRHFN